MTRRSTKSFIPYYILGALYLYLTYLSVRPEILYSTIGDGGLNPDELPGMLRMLTNETNMASNGMVFLYLDLFWARKIYKGGLKRNIETRHSIILCLIFLHAGYLSNYVTKALAKRTEKGENQKIKVSLPAGDLSNIVTKVLPKTTEKADKNQKIKGFCYVIFGFTEPCRTYIT
ncbi:hypothetical protein Leryth_019212 [Lithospermum erythrorhizon]|nr:hypothetical protein Leryth_019212 [Lithospermum erythrorhizon]